MDNVQIAHPLQGPAADRKRTASPSIVDHPQHKGPPTKRGKVQEVLNFGLDLNEEVWEVEAILAHRDHKDHPGEREYHVKWVGWSSAENTWETRENLLGAPKKLREYENKVGLIRVEILDSGDELDSAPVAAPLASKANPIDLCISPVAAKPVAPTKAPSVAPSKVEPLPKGAESSNLGAATAAATAGRSRTGDASEEKKKKRKFVPLTREEEAERRKAQRKPNKAFVNLQQALGTTLNCKDVPKDQGELEKEIKKHNWKAPRACEFLEYETEPKMVTDFKKSGVPEKMVEECIWQWIRVKKPKIPKATAVGYLKEKFDISTDSAKRILGITKKSPKPNLKKGSAHAAIPEATSNFIRKIHEDYGFRQTPSIEKWDLFTTQCFTKAIRPWLPQSVTDPEAQKMLKKPETVELKVRADYRYNRSKKRTKIIVDKFTADRLVQWYQEKYWKKDPLRLLRDFTLASRYINTVESITKTEKITKKEWEILRELATRLAIPYGQAKNMERKQVSDMQCVESWVYGWSISKFAEKNKKRCAAAANSKNCNTRAIYNLAKRLIALRHPTFKYTSITVNRNIQTKLHTDSGNVGPSYIIAFGKFTGGMLKYSMPDNASMRVFDINNQWLAFNGNNEHGTTKFIGKRFSLVYYEHSVIVEEAKFKKEYPMGLPEVP